MTSPRCARSRPPALSRARRRERPLVVEAEALITNVRVSSCSAEPDRPAIGSFFKSKTRSPTSSAIADADELMADVAEAGRTIASACSEAWRRARPSLRARAARRRRRRRPTRARASCSAPARSQSNTAPTRQRTKPLALRVALAAAERQTLIERDTMDRLANETTTHRTRHSTTILRAAFVGLLGTGDALIPVVEALDQRHIFERYIPEWLLVRNRPQRNAYHRYTVDRHLLEAVARAGEHVSDVARPDLLLLSALLHDIGKVGRGDHSEVGAETARAVMERLGYPEKDVEIVIDLVSMHLVLPDFATRRDLDDPSTAIVVAKAVKDRQRLSLLAALTSADGQATGSAAWGPWKADLVLRLVEKVDAVLSGLPIAPSAPPEITAEQTELVRQGKLAVRASGKHVTVVAPDRPGLLATVAGVLALNGCNVRRAMLNSTDGDMAVDVFTVEPTFDRLPDWAKVERDVESRS